MITLGQIFRYFAIRPPEY